MEKENDCKYTCICLCVCLCVITLLSYCLFGCNWCKELKGTNVIFLILNIICIFVSILLFYKNTRILSKTTNIISDLKNITDNYKEISRHEAKYFYNSIKDNKDDLYKTIEVITKSFSDKCYDESRLRILKELITDIIRSHEDYMRARK